MTWIHTNTIIGPAAEGSKYLKRPEINELFWRSIINGEHVLFAAPRRVGKSSVMKDLEKTPPPGIIAIYQNVEADKYSKEFYERLWTLIVDQLNKAEHWKTKISAWLKTKGLEEFTITDGKFKFETKELDFKKELLDLVEEIGKEKDIVVLLLDEFPDAVNNIRKNEGDAQAVDLLHVMRAIRHDAKFKNFRLVLAGSIGLEHVVASIDRIKLINDLKRIPVNSLEDHEVDQLLNIMLSDATIQLGKDETAYLKQKIKHWLPYFFQLIIAKCNVIAHKKNDPVITKALIDEAFAAVLTENEHFSDWEKRLRDYLDRQDYDYCIGVLTRCAHTDFTLQQAYNYSKKDVPETGYMSLLDDILVKDGYLFREGNNLKFISPFLQEWWKNRHPEYEIED